MVLDVGLSQLSYFEQCSKKIKPIMLKIMLWNLNYATYVSDNVKFKLYEAYVDTLYCNWKPAMLTPVNGHTPHFKSYKKFPYTQCVLDSMR